MVHRRACDNAVVCATAGIFRYSSEEVRHASAARRSSSCLRCTPYPYTVTHAAIVVHVMILSAQTKRAPRMLLRGMVHSVLGLVVDSKSLEVYIHRHHSRLDSQRLDIGCH